MLQSRTGAGERAALRRSAARRARDAARELGDRSTLVGCPTVPFDQSTYQVRLEWGVDGLARLAPADIVVVVDVLRFSTTVIEAVERGEDFPLDAAARAVSINGAAVAEAAARDAARWCCSARCATPRRSRAPSSPSSSAAAADEHRRDRRGRARPARCRRRGALRRRRPARRGRDHRRARRARHRSHIARRRGRVGVVPRPAPCGEAPADRERIGARAHRTRDSATRCSTAAAVDAASVVPVLRDGVFRAL